MKKKSIQERLNEVQKGCRERTVTEDEIVTAIKSAENKLLSLNIPKKYWVDCIVEIIQGSVPNKYKYVAYGTYVKVIRRKTTWEVFVISRDKVSSCSGGSFKHNKLSLSKIAIDSMKHAYYI